MEFTEFTEKFGIFDQYCASMKMISKLLPCFAALVLISTLSFGQGKRHREYSGFFDTYYYRGPIAYTLGVGLSAYRGDLAPSFGGNALSYSFSVGANYKVWPKIILGAEFNYFALRGEDSDSILTRSFTAGGNWELMAYGRYLLIDDIVRVSRDRRKAGALCKPYIITGIGMARTSASFQYDLLSFEDTLSYSQSAARFGVMVPAGFGFQFAVTQRVQIVSEFAYRFVFTDILDAYAASKPGSDGYAFAQIKLQYSPSAPKTKKASALPPPAQYTGPKGTETWKTKKESEQQQQETYPDQQENTEENQENQNTEENTDENTEEYIEENTDEENQDNLEAVPE